MVPARLFIETRFLSRVSGLARGPAAAAAPDQYGSAAPRRQRPKETLPVGRAVGAPAPVSRGQTSKAQTWLHESNKSRQNSDAYRSYRAVKLLGCGGWLACL